MLTVGVVLYQWTELQGAIEMNAGADEMAMTDAVRHELTSRLLDVPLDKTHLSLRLEPGTRVLRIGACITPYTWETRRQVLNKILEFEDDHRELAVEFDIIPIDGVADPEYAEA